LIHRVTEEHQSDILIFMQPVLWNEFVRIVIIELCWC